MINKSKISCNQNMNFQDDNINLEYEVDSQIVENSNRERKLDNLDVNTLVDKDVNKLEFLEIDPEKEFETLHLQDNVLTRGVVPLEELFDFNDVGKKLKINPS